MGKNKVVGFFGGTFDPLHLGHIQLAITLKEKAALDAVFFCPTALSPTKKSSHPLASAKARLEMVKRGIQDIQGFHLIEEEIHETAPCYTIDTIRNLIKKYPHTTFRLILGQDHVPYFTSWKEWDELIHLAPPLVGARSVNEVQNPLGLEILNTPIFDISASDIRFRMKNELYVGHLISASVHQYIRENKLYL